MIERKHGAFTHRQNPILIAKVINIKRDRFNELAEVRIACPAPQAQDPLPNRRLALIDHGDCAPMQGLRATMLFLPSRQPRQAAMRSPDKQARARR